MDNSERTALRVAGALTGFIFVSSLDAQVSELKIEAARLLGVDSPDDVKIIAKGRTLQDNTKRLAEYGIGADCRLLVTRGAADSKQASREEERANKLSKLRNAAQSLAARDARGLTDDYAFSLENQDGTKLQMKEEDRKALVMGLALHAKARKTLEQGDFQGALDELVLGEEAFGLVDPAITDSVDNVALLLIDLAWCCFKLQDTGRLAVGRQRLERARAILTKAFGPNAERLRALHGNFFPELATYVRLDLLEGVVAFAMRDMEAAEKHLRNAERRWQQLQVSDRELASLQEMGYQLQESTRALRFSGGDIGTAVGFITEQRLRQEEREDKKKKRQEWNNKRVKLGKTATGNYVDQDALGKICHLGYDEAVAAEALRLADNNGEAALEMLLDPVKRGAMELAMVAKSIKSAHGKLEADPVQLAELVAAGYSEYYAREALVVSKNDHDATMRALEHWGDMVWEGRARDGSLNGALAEAMDIVAGEAGPSTSGASTSATGTKKKPAVAKVKDTEEKGLADEITASVTQSDDPMAVYDLDVSEEGNAIQLYLSMLASSQQPMQR